MGPALNILLRESYPSIGALWATIDPPLGPLLADGTFFVRPETVVSGDLRGEPRPFLINYSPISVAPYEPWELGQIARLLTGPPVAMVTLGAMANQPIDHRILASLALAVAERFGGVIDFDTLLNVATTQVPTNTLLTVAPSEGGSNSVFHVGNATFLRTWLSSPEFHLVK